MPALDSFLSHLRELETTKEEQRPFGVSPLSEAFVTENSTLLMDGMLIRTHAIRITCDSMDEEKMHAYLAFCERALLGGNDRVTGGQRNNGESGMK